MTKGGNSNRYGVLNSSITKQQLKAIKHHEIDLQKKESNISRDKVKENITGLTYNNLRKAVSTEKMRPILSHKLSSGFPSRKVGMLSSQKSRDKASDIKNLYNKHAITANQRQFNAASKRKSLANQSLNDDFKKYLISQENGHKIAYAQSPEILKGKAELVQNNSNYVEKSNWRAQQPYDATYMSRDKKFKDNLKDLSEGEEVMTAVTPIASITQERLTTTPLRKGLKSISKVFKIDQEAFIHPDISQAENLIINLEDIVKEEKILFELQENISQHSSIQEL